MTVKKKIWISAVSFLVVVFLIVSYLLITNHTPTDLSINIDFTEQITIINRDATTIITDKEHIHDIVILIQGGIKPWPRGLSDQIACPFDITLLFEGRDSNVRVSLATDDCGAISVDGRMYEIDLDNKIMLFDILQ